MKKKVLLIIPPTKFNEDELFKPQAVLEAADIEVTVASTTVATIDGDYGGSAEAAVCYETVAVNAFDCVAIIGGTGTIEHLWDDEHLLKFVRDAYVSQKLVAGICAGAVVIAQTGLLAGRKGTCYPVDIMIHQLMAHEVVYQEAPVVPYKDIITADGPDGAEAFGKAIAAALLN